MKATLEFDLPDDKAELELATIAGQMYSTIDQVDALLRNQLKHGDETKDRSTMERCRHELADILARFQ